MRIGFIGLGKLGLPCATCLDMLGHDIMGYDISPDRMSKKSQPYQEAGPDGKGDFNDFLAKSSLKFGTMSEVAEYAEIIFVAVQTPHGEMYEGITRIPDERRDFNYTYLKNAIHGLAQCVKKETPIVIISTCLPGTMKKHIKPLMNKHMKLVYNPFFIAMGTTMRDFTHPEFTLIGVDEENTANKIISFYKSTLRYAPVQCMSIESAELTKVCYNTFISLKIAFVNTVMEICDKIPNADVNSVTDALKAATTRLISPAYLTGGMGDGGGCHPRDNIAMSWLAKELDLSFDLFDCAMKCREAQTEYLANVIKKCYDENDLMVYILGGAFKANTNLIVGSPAVLLKNLLEEKNVTCKIVDKHCNINKFTKIDNPAIYFIGCKHSEYAMQLFPEGSIVIDPFRYVFPDQKNVKIISIGKGL